ncbi:hypothetical protein CAL65_14085 [Alkalilimnicola ehrlichii]|uniref:Uncharacterized protein n=2 Tax=Alkalilimnicola ehrlichii TaxID=351052 RepID=A0A3E0WPB8_9GAMM|nr:hypothetical protein CAL65_14085 [Alkalilimnicola ehrlichii]
MPDLCKLPQCSLTAVSGDWPQHSHAARTIELEVGPELVLSLPKPPQRVVHRNAILTFDLDGSRLIFHTYDAEAYGFTSDYGFDPFAINFVDFLRNAFEKTPEEEPKETAIEKSLFRYSQLLKAMQDMSEDTTITHLSKAPINVYYFQPESRSGQELHIAFVSNDAAPNAFLEIRGSGLSKAEFQQHVSGLSTREAR